MAPDEAPETATVPASTIQVEVVLALPERAWSAMLTLVDGATVSEALERAWQQFPQMPETAWSYGIYGRPVTPATLLRNGDRIELLRPLLADPMDQRWRRAAQR
jgi:putative ubiquitin-RnfH superfamily antitoxin RatB of RatAB toxin-antitoxin module